MTVLDEMWYGNIDPVETVVDGNRYYKGLLSLMGRNRDELSRELSEAQKETLEKYDDNVREMNSISEKEAFKYGFRLGVKIMTECMGEERLDENE